VPRRHLDNYLLPEFGDRVPAEITPANAAHLLAKVSKRAPTAANDLFRFMRRVFRFGVRRHLLPSNPVSNFDQQDAGGPERKRRRALSRGELEDLFKALREPPCFGGENFLAIKLLLALGVRKGELLNATWGEFDFEGSTDAGPVWRPPGSRTKTGEPQTIPLVPEVMGWLQALHVVWGVNTYVFLKRRRDPRQLTLHVGVDALNAPLAGVKHGVAHFTLHDLRPTMRTQLAAQGVRSELPNGVWATSCVGSKARTTLTTS
jgi:integrase